MGDFPDAIGVLGPLGFLGVEGERDTTRPAAAEGPSRVVTLLPDSGLDETLHGK